MIRLRLERLAEPDAAWLAPEGMKRRLQQVGYYGDRSVNWLEHYNTACCYALPTVTELNTYPRRAEEDLQYDSYAYEAIHALDRAAKHGDRVEFVTSKRYWLEAGDPDLAGLRRYQSFRAFEARVYGHPLPATAELAKYELYRFLRAVVRRAARYLEDEWRKRSRLNPAKVDYAEFEDWWRQELRAWETAIRIGRFYRQWQTRHSALDAIREWAEAQGPDALPIPYPNITRSDYLPDTGEYDLREKMLTETEEIFRFLGTKCGNLTVSESSEPTNAYENTQAWSEYAAESSRLGRDLTKTVLVTACRARLAAWASLRQWAQSPRPGRARILAAAIDGLPDPSVVRADHTGWDAAAR
jgi:hypothetical protein